MEDTFTLFPQLRERADAPGGVLSGGEQQMLTICRTLMGNPDLIMVDEPTEGLAPMLVELVRGLLEKIAERGIAILLIEQKLTIALQISNRVYVMGHGASSSRARHATSKPPRRCAGNGWRSRARMPGFSRDTSGARFSSATGVRFEERTYAAGHVPMDAPFLRDALAVIFGG
jgi:energy-coupling factor transporter ATP-binding protein EcfA2